MFFVSLSFSTILKIKYYNNSLSFFFLCGTVSFVMLHKTCVHSFSSYLIFMPLLFFLFVCILLFCTHSIHFLLFMSSFASYQVRHHQIIIITNCHEQGSFPFAKRTKKKSSRNTQKRHRIDGNLCSENA